MNLPLGGFRNYQALIDLVPGATPSTFQNSLTDTPGRALRTNINGGNAQTNITQIDGAESINVWLPHHVGYVVPAEDVARSQHHDQRGGCRPGAGRRFVHYAGDQIRRPTRSTAAPSNSTTTSISMRGTSSPSDKPVAIYNNYGGTVGGPILKNKLFYFISFDGTNQKIAANGFFTVPTDDQKRRQFQFSI